MKTYAGVGSRETPKDICDIFEKIGELLARSGYTLYSGGAEGADAAFETGCNIAQGPKKIFIPWKNFNKSDSALVGATKIAQATSKEVISWWDKLGKWPKILHGRNAYQVLGEDLKSPVDCVICWTEGGKPTGGTRTAIMLAKKHDIKVYNFGLVSDIKAFETDFNFNSNLYEDF